jgi:heme-degrading monooxygenase HmoA
MPPLPWTAIPTADAASDDVVVMASLLQLDSLRRTPGFLRAAMAIRKQVLGAEGAVGVALNTALPRRTFFTLSAWRDREALNAFVRSEPHASTMRRYRPVMKDARFVVWGTAADNLPPSWTEAQARLREGASKSQSKSPTATG